MKKIQPFLALFFTALIVCLLLLNLQPALGQAGNQFYIVDMHCSDANWPFITLQVRGVDADGTTIPADLLTENFELYENDQIVPLKDLTGITEENSPKYVVFSFDLGKDSNLNDTAFSVRIQDALDRFASHYFADGTDIVEIVSHNNRQKPTEVMPPSQVKADFEKAISNLDLSRSTIELKGFQGLNDLYNDLVGLKPGQYSIVVIHFIFVPEGLTYAQASADSVTIGDMMNSKNIRLFLFSTDTYQTYPREYYEALATHSGGEYIILDEDYADKITDIYDRIDANTKAIRIPIRAAQLDATYSVVPKGLPVGDATDSRSCPSKINLPPVEVKLTEPSGVNPVVSPTTIKVTAALQNWPEKGTRRVKRVELLVNDNLADQQDFTPTSDLTEFTFNVDISKQKTLDNKIRLAVRVIDEWNVDGRAETTVIVSIPATVTPTKTPASKPTPTRTSICQEKPSSPGCIGSTVLGFLVGNLTWITLILLLIVIIVMFITNRKLAKLASPAREAISKGFDQVRKTLLGGMSAQQDAIGYLNVLIAREDRKGGKIPIYNNRTSLGRDPKVTDVQLYQIDDQSTVSSLHCTIFHERGKFFITDDNSANGTFVNGKRLNANDPFELKDGAEIVLGDVYRQGAKLRFEISTGGVGEGEGLPVAEADFHMDLPAGEPYPAAPAPAVDEEDSRKTVPGYRRPEDVASPGDYFREPPAASPPQPRPAKPSEEGKRDKKDWKDELG